MVFWTAAIIAGRLTAYSLRTVFETLLALAGLALALGLVAYARRAQANRTARRRAAFGIPTAVKEGE